MDNTALPPDTAPFRHSLGIHAHELGERSSWSATGTYQHPGYAEAEGNAVNNGQAFPESNAIHHTAVTSSPRTKWITYLLSCIFTFLATANILGLLPAIPRLMPTFTIDIDRAGSVTIYTILLFALGNIIWIPLIRLIGIRLVHLLALLLLIAANIWAARVSTFRSLLAARILSGFAAAAADCTLPGLEWELWLRQSRAWRLMLYQFTWVSGLCFGPLISGYILQTRGSFRWIPGWLALGFGVVLLGFLLVEVISRRTSMRVSSGKVSLKQRLGMPIIDTSPAKTLFASLRDSLVVAIHAPALWSAILLGVLFGSTIVVQLAALATFSLRYWQIDRIGLFNIAGWIGAVLALPLGLIIDKLLRRHTQPLQRQLLLVALPTVVAPVGLIVYGACLSTRNSWLGPAFGYAMHTFGLTLLGTSLVTLLMDTYEAHSPEVVATFCTIRGLIAVLCCAFYRSWSTKDGLMAVFGTLAGLEWAFFALVVPLYFFWPRVSRRKGPLTSRNYAGDEAHGALELSRVALKVQI